MTTEIGAQRPTAATETRQPGDQRRSRSARRHTERASRARQLADREAQAWHFKAAGYTNAEIGRLLVAEGDAALTNQTVSNILAAAEAKIGFHSTAQAIASVRSQQLARLEHVYSEAMAAWRHSKEAEKSASKRTSRGVARGQRSVLATTEHETIAQTVNDRANCSRAAATPTRHKGQHSRKDGTHLTVHIDRLLERLLEVGCQVGPIGCSRWGRIRPQPHVNEVPAGAPGSTRDEHCCTVQYNMTSAYRHTAQGDAGPSPCTRRVAA